MSDVSASGCFVHGLALPQPGEQTIVTINFTASYSMAIASEVVYIERTIGFSVVFVEMDAVRETQLRDFLESFRQASA